MFRLALALPLLFACAADAKTSHVYKTVDGKELQLHVTQPEGLAADERRPAVLFFHGGGWVGGAPGQFDEHAKHLAEHGLVSVQVQYRLLDRKSKEPPVDCIEDVRDALDWVRDHAAEFHIDADRIATAGGSAGGHLAAVLGTITRPDGTPKRPQAMLLFNPVYDNGAEGGWGQARVQGRVQEFSPAHNITKETPPAIVFLGTKDNLIPVSTAKRFQKNMTDAGVKSVLHLYAGEGHGFFNARKGSMENYLQTLKQLDAFLAELGWITLPDRNSDS